jgi:hypothetical protein
VIYNEGKGRKKVKIEKWGILRHSNGWWLPSYCYAVWSIELQGGIKSKMENNLNLILNRRGPQFFLKWKTSFFF